MQVNSTNYPAAFAAMDQAASEFWAYPDLDWQDAFLRQWAQVNNCEELMKALQT